MKILARREGDTVGNEEENEIASHKSFVELEQARVNVYTLASFIFFNVHIFLA